MNKPDYLISTPENVDLHLELAGLANRVLAAVVDHTLLIGAALLVIIVALGIAYATETSGLDTEKKVVIYYYLIGVTLFCVFLINFGYFILFEGMWHGQTPGKRMAGIRVIEQNGQPVGWSGVWIRNLLRVVDEIPIFYPGMLPMIIDKNERRFGDFAAGTVVIRERLQSITASGLSIDPKATVSMVVDTGQITPDEYTILVNFLKRRAGMAKSFRQNLSRDIAQHFKQKLALQDAPEAAEPFIETLFIAYKQRADLEKS